MQVVMNKSLLFKPWKKIDADPSCRFREKCKNRAFNFKKWRHRAVD